MEAQFPKRANTFLSSHLTPVMFMFERKGLVEVTLDKSLQGIDKAIEDVIEAALGAEAEDFDQKEDDENPNNILLKVGFQCPDLPVATC